MELTIIKQVQEFKWNFDEIKTALAAHIEKYNGLVVTKDNLKDMEAAQKEVASIRIKIDGFRKEVKKKLEEPYKQFETEIKELQELVEQAEKPLKEQILQYEDDRQKKLEDDLQLFANTTGAGLGVKVLYLAKLVIKPEWLKRTAKLAATKKEIVTEVEALLEQQRADAQAVEMKHQRFKLIEQLCASQSKAFNLSTEITAVDVAALVETAGLEEIPGIITSECQRRADIEQKAAEEARMKAEAHKAVPETPAAGPSVPIATSTETNSDGGEDIPAPPVKGPSFFTPTAKSVPLPPRPVCTPPPPPVTKEPEQLWNVDMQILAVTVPQAEALKTYMTDHGILFHFSNYEKVTF